MDQVTLRSRLRDWTDIDGAMLELAHSIGLMGDEVSFGQTKHVFWSQNTTGQALGNMLNELVRAGILEYREKPDYQYRWNENFKGTWE